LRLLQISNEERERERERKQTERSGRVEIRVERSQFRELIEKSKHIPTDDGEGKIKHEKIKGILSKLLSYDATTSVVFFANKQANTHLSQKTLWKYF